MDRPLGPAVQITRTWTSPLQVVGPGILRQRTRTADQRAQMDQPIRCIGVHEPSVQSDQLDWD